MFSCREVNDSFKVTKMYACVVNCVSFVSSEDTSA